MFDKLSASHQRAGMLVKEGGECPLHPTGCRKPAIHRAHHSMREVFFNDE